jgi:hypothetical protein
LHLISVRFHALCRTPIERGEIRDVAALNPGYT